MVKDWIRSYIKGHLKHFISKGEVVKYLFLRLLAELVWDTPKDDVYFAFGKFLSNKGRELYQFSDIFAVGDTVYIVTYRPGLWIGKSGSTIKELEGLLGRYKVKIIEERNTAFSEIADFIRVLNEC